jgi:predicted acyltransferase
MTAKTNRIATIDMLRGIAIVGMILCANIGFNSGLPAWMFHAQTPPPTYAFNPDVPGITWVDLVFPFFLFSMGAAFPLAMRKRLESGMSRWKVTGSLLKRWFILSAFGLILGCGIVALILMILYKPADIKKLDDKYRAAAGKELDDALVGRK